MAGGWHTGARRTDGSVMRTALELQPGDVVRYADKTEAMVLHVLHGDVDVIVETANGDIRAIRHNALVRVVSSGVL